MNMRWKESQQLAPAEVSFTLWDKSSFHSDCLPHSTATQLCTGKRHKMGAEGTLLMAG